MATATATVTVNEYPNGVNNSQRRQEIYGLVAIQAAAATYAAGGLAISWAKEPIKALLNAAGLVIPQWVQFQSRTGSGFVYMYNYTSNKLQIFTGAAAQAALTELTDGAAIPAGVSGDSIGFRAEFIRQ